LELPEVQETEKVVRRRKEFGLKDRENQRS